MQPKSRQFNLPIPKYAVYIFFLFLLIRSCKSDSFENNYSEEIQDQVPKRVFRLFVKSNEEFSYPNFTNYNSIKSNISPNIDNSIWSLSPNFTTVSSTVRSEELERDHEFIAYDENQAQEKENDLDLLDVFSNSQFPLAFPTKRTALLQGSTGSGNLVVESDSAHKFAFPLFKNAQRDSVILPASHIDASHIHDVKVQKESKKVYKRRKPVTDDPTNHEIQPISSLRIPTSPPTPPPPDSNNVSLIATFSTPETEESSSIELELYVSGKMGNENHQTKIQILNPENSCVQIYDKNRKRTLLNVWSFTNGKLKLESQREVPASIFNGTKVVDGELLNRGEIPQPVANVLSTLLTGIGRSDNVTVLNNVHIPESNENLFGGNRRRNVIMLHYILWGQREKAWRVMLDKTVENYLRNYFISTFGIQRLSRKSKKKTNWRKMRNVLLSFMASPDVNCTTAQPSKPNNLIIQRDDLIQDKFYHLKPTIKTPLLSLPVQKNKQPPTNQKFNQLITRNEGGGWGWQQNGWGGQQQQGWGVQQQGGWGAPQGWGNEKPQGWGWGWGDQDKKKKKKKKGGKKKKKKKKKGGKKKKKKGKKGKKNKKGGDGWGWGDPPGWGGGVSPGWGGGGGGSGWGPITWNDYEVHPGEWIHKSLALIGLFGLPIALFVACILLMYFITNKNGGSAGHYIHSSYHQPSTPQVIYSGGFPRFGWRRRTENPTVVYYDEYNPSASTLNPDSWKQHDYYNVQGINNVTNWNGNLATIKSIKKAPLTFADIKDSSSFRRNKISDYYPRIRDQGGLIARKNQYEHRNYKQYPYYDDYYDLDFNYNKYEQMPARTKHEEELVKILSKHKTAQVAQLLEKWKIDKLRKSWG